MDGSLAEASTRGNLVSQQCLSASDRYSSPSVSQQGVLCGDANTLENQVRDNKPLNTFDAQPYEARSMLFPYRQEMSVLKGASEESTASDRRPSSSSLVECIDQPSGASIFIKNKKTGESLVNNGSDDTGVPLCGAVKLTCTNAIIECLQYEKYLSADEIFYILAERLPSKNGRPKYKKRSIASALSMHRDTFVYEANIKAKTKNADGHQSGVWRLKEYKVNAMNNSVEVGSIDNNPVFAKGSEVPGCKNKTVTKFIAVSGYKNEIIECLMHGERMSMREISKYITMKRQSRNINDKVNEKTISNVLALHKIFKLTSKSGNCFDQKKECWFMEESVREKFRTSKEFCSIAPISSSSIDFINLTALPKGFEVPVGKRKHIISKVKVHSCKNEIIECLRYGAKMSIAKICENINRRRKSRNEDKEIRRRSVADALSANRGIFERTEISGSAKCGVWWMTESVRNKYLSFEGLDSINFIDIPPLVSDVNIDTFPSMVCRCFETRKVLTLLEVYAAVLKQHPDIKEQRPHWKSGVRKALRFSKYLQWTQSDEGVSNQNGFWHMTKSMKKSVGSDEPLKSSNVVPPFPIIQPRLSPIASREGVGASAMASQMDQSAGMVSIDHDNKLPTEWLCRSEEGGSLGTQDESLTNEGPFSSQENFLLLQEFLESNVRKTRTIKTNNVERIFEEELIECVNAGEKLAHNKYDENREEQNLYINKNEYGYFDEELKSESKKLVAPPFMNPSVENDNNFGGAARPVQFGCILGSPLIDKGYNDVNIEEEDL